MVDDQALVRAGFRMVLDAQSGERRETLVVDTTRGSVLHAWARAGGRRESLLRTYVASVLVTYVPLAIAATKKSAAAL